MDHRFNKPIIFKPEGCIVPDVRIINAIFKSQDERVLLFKRSENSTYFPGFYHILSGKLIVDENYIDGLRREIQEETGIVINKDDIVGESDLEYSKWDGKVFEIKKFCLKFNDDRDIVLNEEHSEYRWVKRDEIGILKTTSQVQDLVDLFC